MIVGDSMLMHPLAGDKICADGIEKLLDDLHLDALVLPTKWIASGFSSLAR